MGSLLGHRWDLGVGASDLGVEARYVSVRARDIEAITSDLGVGTKHPPDFHVFLFFVAGNSAICIWEEKEKKKRKCNGNLHLSFAFHFLLFLIHFVETAER